MRLVSVVLAAGGSLALADAAITVLWQEPLTALQADSSQRSLSAELAHAGRLRIPGLERLPAHAQIASMAAAMRRDVRSGDAIGRIRIPRFGADFVVVQGTRSSSLSRGPGHYAGTSWPGLPGTVGIAGHRTTHLAPFRKLNLVRPGDPIILEMPYGRFVYRAERRIVVRPRAYAYVMRSVGYARLALTACHPLYSASERMVVFGRLVSTRARPGPRPRHAESAPGPAAWRTPTLPPLAQRGRLGG